MQGVSPGGEEIPACTPRSLWIGSDTRNAGYHEVIPVLDVLRITLAHQENNCRGIGCAVVRKALLPVSRQQACTLGNGVDVIGQGERNNIRLQTINDSPSLLG